MLKVLYGMALFHIKTQILKRSKGQNVIEAIAYRRAARLKDERTGQIFDYTRKRSVIHSEIVIPQNAPAWIQDIHELQKTNPNKAAERLWNSVENHEKRKDAQLARELNIALPIEFNQEQCIALTREYVQLFCEEGMVVDFSIHWDKGNPHAHITVAMRGLTVEGWGHKERAWNGKDFHEKTMVHLAEVTNKHLDLARFDARISHLSYAAQGIDLEPTIHEGNKNNLANQQARARNKEIRLRNLQKIIENPTVLLDKLSKEKASFSLEDIAKTLGTQLEAANQEVVPTPTPPKLGGLVSRLSSFVASNLAPRFLTEPQPLNGTVASLHAIETAPNFQFETETPLQEIIHTVLQAITQKESVFNERYLTKVLSQHLQNPEAVTDALLQLKASSELMMIGPGEDGRERYTTREMFDLENNLQELAEQLSGKTTHKVNARIIQRCIQEFKLKDDQAKAIRHILKGSDIAIVVGRAGTGKSYSLKAAKAAWELSGYRVHGIAIAGIAADNLAEDSGIDSRTIESFCCALREGALVLNSKDVVVMDEAGMADSLSLLKVLLATTKAGAKLVLVGDHAQLQPIGPGAIFRALLERIGFAELTTIRRQIETWQREATAHFAAGRTAKALDYYENHDCILLAESHPLALQTLIQDWATSIQESPLSENLILAYENTDIQELNKLARQHLIEKGVLSNSVTLQNKTGKIDIAQGERILFLENSFRYSVKNGQRATVIGYERDNEGNVISIQALLDGKKSKIIEFNPNKYQKFSYGYATTVHRAQGTTVNHTFVLALRLWHKHLSYVAMTRHRLTAKLYSHQELYPSLNALKKSMNKIGIKDSVLDYPLAFAARRGINVDSIAARFQKHVLEKLKWIGQSLKNNFEETFFPGQYWTKKALNAEKQQQLQEILTRREDARVVAAYVDANRELGIAYEALSERKKTLGITEDTPTKEAEQWLKNDSSLVMFREANAARDALAAQIYPEHGHYTKALEIYEIGLEKLEKESKAHEARQRVAQYWVEVNQGRTIHRDKLAFIIQQNIKTHYGALLAMGICQKTLKRHATAHERRDILRKYTLTEREDFKMVEHYIQLAQKSGRLWSQIITQEKAQKVAALISAEDLTLYEIARLQALAKTGTPISHELLIEARETVQARDKWAAEIYHNAERYKKALDFYEFGQLKNINTSNTHAEFDLKAEQWAKERLEKLEKQALAFNNQEIYTKTVKDYVTALNAQQEQRYAIAAQIIENKKLYYPHIFELFPDAFTILKAIHQDARYHQRQVLLASLSSREQKAFLQVEEYAKAKKTVGQIWSETKDLSDPIPAIVQNIRKPYLVLRDTLASDIYQEPALYEKAFVFFKVKHEHLGKEAFYHQVRRDLTEFKKRTGDLNARMALARKIVSNRSAYVIAKEDGTVNWHILQNYADYAIKMERLASLTPTEQADYHTVLKYKRLRREAGKHWGLIFKQKADGKEISEALFDQGITLNAKRNALAFQIKAKREQCDEFLFSAYVQTKDIEKHALSHEKFVQKQAEIQRHNQHNINFVFPSSQPINPAQKLSTFKVKEPKSYWDVQAVNEALSFRAAIFVESLLGAPNHKLSNSTNYRYGKKGSLSIH